jgi:hypothetical protein
MSRAWMPTINMCGYLHLEPYADTNHYNKGFDWDKFYELLVKWIVVSNQPFTEVEVPEFHNLLTFLKLPVGNRMVKADQMHEKIMALS